MTCDSEIKLFGKIFPVIFSSEYSSNGNSEIINDEGSESVDYQNQEVEKDDVELEFSEGKMEEEGENQMMEESSNLKTSLESENSRETPTKEDPQTVKSIETENDQNNLTNSQQKNDLKKPDKILPCPRCNSMDTKFCYYNNNNVNQPRHFCRSCQRYWTAGGTMRNLPVGAGRRKNKNSASHYRHMNIPEGILAAAIELPNGFKHQMLKPNGTVLSFGPDVPLGESMASALNPAEERAPDVIPNGFYNLQNKNSSCKGGENGDDCAKGSSFTTSNTMAGEVIHEAVMHNINSFSPQVPCLHGVPWPFPWNAAVPMSAICPIGFPMPFYPAPYWNCSVPPWSIPWMSPPPQPENEKASSCDPNSALGKHSREGDLLKPKNSDGKGTSEQKNSERTILVPKTLRIDDPDEAAKSSIWSTLGIKYDSASRERFFNALQPKSDDKDNRTNTSPPVLHTNPAALSRSLIFQEKAQR